jgi:diguanylate cyclase (GGDEF)-like protein
MLRTKAVPVLALLMAIAAIVTIVGLQRSADSSRGAQLDLASVNLQLARLQDAPFRASPATGGSPELAQGLIQHGKSSIRESLNRLKERGSQAAALESLPTVLRADYAILDRIYAIGVATAAFGAEADHLSADSARLVNQASGSVDAASREYAGRADSAQTRAAEGAASVILILLAGFTFFYVRSVIEAREKRKLLVLSRQEALTDALTGLSNRRALLHDLIDEISKASDDEPLAVALFDLDGFKGYNDTFGHPAGDALLHLLGQRLTAAVADVGVAYRMGGDEFCVLARGDAQMVKECIGAAAMALCDHGDGFQIGSSYGVALVPTDARDTESALRLADSRMYSDKTGRQTTDRQSADVLLQVLNERGEDLALHLSGVAALAEPAAERLGLSTQEIRRIHMAAELHDIGKSGIPDAILNKPGPLDPEEWAFMRRHTVIGERILLAAPALTPTAELVRSSHERFDGDGYPDGLKGDEIPLGARIVAVCDAFDAMISDRPYRDAMPVADAVAELRRCSGAQFDPRVVEVVLSIIEESGNVPSSAPKPSVPAQAGS